MDQARDRGLVIAGAAMLGWRAMDVQEGAPQVTASIAAGTGEIARQPLPTERASRPTRDHA